MKKDAINVFHVVALNVVNMTKQEIITACNQLAIQTQLEASLDVYARTINDALTLSNPSATSNAVAISATSNAVAISGENSGENPFSGS